MADSGDAIADPRAVMEALKANPGFVGHLKLVATEYLQLAFGKAKISVCTIAAAFLSLCRVCWGCFVLFLQRFHEHTVVRVSGRAIRSSILCSLANACHQPADHTRVPSMLACEQREGMGELQYLQPRHEAGKRLRTHHLCASRSVQATLHNILQGAP